MLQHTLPTNGGGCRRGKERRWHMTRLVFFCVHPLGLFMARAGAGRYCTVQIITSSWTRRSGLLHLNHHEDYAAHICPSSTCITGQRNKNNRCPQMACYVVSISIFYFLSMSVAVPGLECCGKARLLFLRSS